MATVYRAEDVKHGREVAIKVLRPELVTGYETARFLREIRIAAGLTHPQILPLHDSGECDGFFFYVMPFVGCESLRDRLNEKKRLPIHDAIRITLAVAGALDYAHRRNVLHRDIKPENILLNEGQPLLTDFGVATAISAAGSDRLTEPGLAVGTPAYMSPEQVTADRELDARSDLYSLACVLFEMLTGEPPFRGPNARATMAQHAIQPPPSVRSQRGEVPLVVDQVIARALAKDPAQRFDTVRAFTEALTSTDPPASAAADRNTRMIAVLPFENASPDPDNEYLSDGLTDELIHALTKVEGLHVASRTSVFAFKGTRQDVRAIGAQLGVSTVLEGTVRQSGNRLRITARLTDVSDGRHLWAERYDREVDDIFAVEDEITRTIVMTLRTTLWRDLGELRPRRYTDNVKAYNAYLRGRYHWNLRTPEDILRAIEYFEQAIQEDPDYALAYTGLSDAHAIQVDYRGSPVAERMEQAKVEARRALELDETLAEAHTSLAWVNFIYDWDWTAAEREFRRAIELNPSYATARQWFAWLLLATGRGVEALQEARMAVDLDPVSVSGHRGLGWLCYYLGRHEEAVEHLRRALAIDPQADETHSVLGLVYTALGRFEEAEAAFRDAIATAQKTAAYAMAGWGYMEARRGRRAETERLLVELEQLSSEGYISPVAFVLLHVALGDPDAVFQWLDRCYEERRGWLAYLRVEPKLETVRNDPRFDSLVTRMGF